MAAKRYIDIFKMYDRFFNGERIDESDWDYRIVPENAKRMKERYDIKFGTNIIPEDQDLADRLFLAGVDMLLTCGIYNTETGTRMTMTEDELYEGLKMAPKRLKLGDGKDYVMCSERRGNIMNKPIVEGGPTGAPITEDLYTPIMESYAREPVVDTVVTGVLRTVKGFSVVKNSPWEIKATLSELSYTREALYNAGRPGMAI